MPCNHRSSLIEAAVCTLIKEMLSTLEARRRARERAKRCEDFPPQQEQGELLQT
jgi:hypothetical protein